MKCKCAVRSSMSDRVTGLIEAYWNVNTFYINDAPIHVDGLIEAYWNVNFVIFIQRLSVSIGLIEAYWNVN